MKLYAVVTIEEKDKYREDGSSYRGMDKRIPGIYTTLEAAKSCVENNVGDIWEMSYDLVIIEETETDYVYPHSTEFKQYWYAWKGAEGWDSVGTKGYVACECPEKYKNTVGFGIG